MRRLKWPDADLIDCLEKGFDYLCDDTPPVSTFSPRYLAAMSQGKEFFLELNKEITKDWFSEAQRVPHFIPFRILPGSIIEKTDGGWRLVWDASWPHPKSVFGTLKLDSEEFVPIDANSHADIPEEYKFEWPSIEALGEIITVLSNAAQSADLALFARTYDM